MSQTGHAPLRGRHSWSPVKQSCHPGRLKLSQRRSKPPTASARPHTSGAAAMAAGGIAAMTARGQSATHFMALTVLEAPMTSGELMRWGMAGRGRWITIYANANHVFAVVAGLRWDTVGDASGTGPRWHEDMVSTAGFIARHPPGTDRGADVIARPIGSAQFNTMLASNPQPQFEWLSSRPRRDPPLWVDVCGCAWSRDSDRGASLGGTGRIAAVGL